MSSATGQKLPPEANRVLWVKVSYNSRVPPAILQPVTRAQADSLRPLALHSESQLQDSRRRPVRLVWQIRCHQADQAGQRGKDQGDGVCHLRGRDGCELAALSAPYKRSELTRVGMLQAKQAFDHLNGFHLQERYLVGAFLVAAARALPSPSVR